MSDQETATIERKKTNEKNEKKEAAEILKGVRQHWATIMHKVKRMNGRVLYNDKG